MSMKDKIRKLLEKAASTNFQEEADTLMAKARKLMEQHQISEIELREEQGKGFNFSTYSTKDFKKGSPAETRYRVEAAVYRYYGCRAILLTLKDRAFYDLHGDPFAIDVARQMFDYIWKDIGRRAKAMLEKESRRNPLAFLSPADDRKFLRKAILDISLVLIYRLAEIREKEKESEQQAPSGSTALVVLNTALQEFVGAQYNKPIGEAKPRKTQTVSEEAMRQGYDINLGRQVGEEAEEEKELLG